MTASFLLGNSALVLKHGFSMQSGKPDLSVSLVYPNFVLFQVLHCRADLYDSLEISVRKASELLHAEGILAAQISTPKLHSATVQRLMS